MNDAARATIFRKPEAETPEKWALLKDAVTGVRSDLQATNIDKIGHPGKWNIRYANGDQPHNEADLTFMVSARNTVLSLMDKIEALYQANASLCDLADGCDNEIPRLRAELAAKEVEIVRLTAEIPKAEEAQALPEPSPVEVENDFAAVEIPALAAFLEKVDVPQVSEACKVAMTLPKRSHRRKASTVATAALIAAVNSL
jgi:hypothetical protein